MAQLNAKLDSIAEIPTNLQTTVAQAVAATISGLNTQQPQSTNHQPTTDNTAAPRQPPSNTHQTSSASTTELISSTVFPSLPVPPASADTLPQALPPAIVPLMPPAP